MSSLLPKLIYKSPGINKNPGGGTYSYVSVQTQEDLDESLSSGKWFMSSGEAIAAYMGINAVIADPIENKKIKRKYSLRDKSKSISSPKDDILGEFIQENLE